MSTIIIDPKGDFLVKVHAYEAIWTDHGAVDRVNEKATFKVSKQALIKYSGKFQAAFRFGEQGTKASEYDVHTESVVSFEVWLRVVHGQGANTALHLREVWNTILVCDDWDFPINMLNECFEEWYNHQPIQSWFSEWKGWAARQNAEKRPTYNREYLDWLDSMHMHDKPRDFDKNNDPRCLLFPCWRFDAPDAFLEVTEFLVYNSPFPVNEVRPITSGHFHLPARIVQQLNAARGRLRNLVFTKVYKPVKIDLLNEKACCDKTACDFQRALLKTKAWPLEEHGTKKSVDTLLKNLALVEYEVSEPTCITCNQNYTQLVKNSCSHARAYFDGLCLDCMDASLAKTEDSDSDYWAHASLTEGDIIESCRVESHGTATWHFSFMGRREEADRFRKEQSAKRSSKKTRNANTGGTKDSFDRQFGTSHASTTWAHNASAQHSRRTNGTKDYSDLLSAQFKVPQTPSPRPTNEANGAQDASLRPSSQASTNQHDPHGRPADKARGTTEQTSLFGQSSTTRVRKPSAKDSFARQLAFMTQ